MPARVWCVRVLGGSNRYSTLVAGHEGGQAALPAIAGAMPSRTRRRGRPGASWLGVRGVLGGVHVDARVWCVWVFGGSNRCRMSAHGHDSWPAALPAIAGAHKIIHLGEYMHILLFLAVESQL